MPPVYTLLVALAVAVVALFLVPSSVAAAPMTLSYTITDLGAPSGTYKYDFTLTLDNHDGTWSPGQKFDYLSFSNETSGSGPFGQFGDWSWTGTPTIASPTFSMGTANGPTLDFCDAGINCSTSFKDGAYGPQTIGERLVFAGLSSTFIDAGLLWSMLKRSGGGSPWQFEMAIYAPLAMAVPDSLLLLLSALAAMTIWRGRSKISPH